MSQVGVASQSNFWWGPVGGGVTGGIVVAALGGIDELQCKTIQLRGVLSSAAKCGFLGLVAFGTASLITTSLIRDSGTERLKETGSFFGVMAKAVPLQWATASGTAFLVGVSKLYFDHRKAPNRFSYAVKVACDSLFKGAGIPFMLALSALSVGGVIGGLKIGESLVDVQ